MKEIEINKKNLAKFYKDISKSDYLELKQCFKKRIKKKFIKLCLKQKNSSYMLADEKNHPTAVGGACEVNYPIQNSAKIWLLTTNNYINHKISLFKYIKNKTDIYKFRYEYIYNYIYKTNFKALRWLTRLGFSVEQFEENKDFQFFYYIRGITNDR